MTKSKELSEEEQTLLKTLYKKHHFPALAKFIKILKDKIKVTATQVKDWISKQNVYQQTKRGRKTKSLMKSVTAYAPFEIIQVDLIDYSYTEDKNKGFTFCLIGIDIFTRQAWAKAVKNKTPEVVLEAFKELFLDLIKADKIKVLFHDSGGEFTGGVFKDYIDKCGIIDKWPRKAIQQQVLLIDFVGL